MINIAFVKEKGGLQYAETKMHEFKEKAILMLDPYPDSPYKEALHLMLNYVVERKK